MNEKIIKRKIHNVKHSIKTAKSDVDREHFEWVLYGLQSDLITLKLQERKEKERNEKSSESE